MPLPSKIGFKIVASALAGLAVLASVARAQSVELEWLDRFDGAANFNDYGVALAADSAGNVVVTGFSFVQEGPGLFSPRYLTIKYAPDGARLWERMWDVGLRADGVDVAIDGLDNVIVTGSLGSSDWGTIKYDAVGTLQWSAVYVTNTPFVEGPENVAVDAAGNVYVSGSEIDLGSATTIKYDPAGNELWVRRYTGRDDGASARGLAVGAEGDVYVAGTTTIGDLGPEFTVVKYDTAGTEQWAKTFGSLTRNAADVAEDVVVDTTGAVVASGYFGGNSLEDQDVATYKLAPDGTVLWSHRHSALTEDEFGAHLAIDSLGNVVVAATTEDSSFVGDLLVLKYSPDGALLWDEIWDAGTGEYEWTTGVAVDPSDRIYAIGTGGWFNYYFAVKYDGVGNFEWFERYDGESGGSMPWDVVVTADRSVYLTGESDSFLNGVEAVTAKYRQPMSLSPPSPGVPDAINSIELSWPHEGETVVLVASGARGSLEVPGCAATTVDIVSARVLGEAVVDAFGSATFELSVPPEAAGRTAYFQAVSRDSCVVSNRVTHEFP